MVKIWFSQEQISKGARSRTGTKPPKRHSALAKEKGCQFVDLKFIDLPGIWQHYTLPISELNESLFEEGNGFDGSSIRGFRPIHESDMLLIPDPATAIVDPD